MLALKARILDLLKSTPHAKSPEAEADQILFHVFRMSNQNILKPSDLTTQSPTVGPTQAMEALFIAENRASGVPLQHLLGYQFFYSREYTVDSSTLIPRPETEILVDEALQWIEKSGFSSSLRFAELGLGSGVISCEILAHVQGSSAVASESSADAIRLATKNLKLHLGDEFTSRIRILKSPAPSSGFEELLPFGPFDLVVSNPPYLSLDDEIENEVRSFEPQSALFPMPEGPSCNPDYFYENLSGLTKRLLNPGGAMILEVPHERASRIKRLFSDSGFSEIRLIPDLSGRPRILFGERNFR
jgi:release factor glutamine methyltransferase